MVVPAGTSPVIILNKLLLYKRILTRNIVEVDRVGALLVTDVLSTLGGNTIRERLSTPVIVPGPVGSELAALTVGTGRLLREGHGTLPVVVLNDRGLGCQRRAAGSIPAVMFAWQCHRGIGSRCCSRVLLDFQLQILRIVSDLLVACFRYFNVAGTAVVVLEVAEACTLTDLTVIPA